MTDTVKTIKQTNSIVDYWIKISEQLGISLQQASNWFLETFEALNLIVLMEDNYTGLYKKPTKDTSDLSPLYDMQKSAIDNDWNLSDLKADTFDKWLRLDHETATQLDDAIECVKKGTPIGGVGQKALIVKEGTSTEQKPLTDEELEIARLNKKHNDLQKSFQESIKELVKSPPAIFMKCMSEAILGIGDKESNPFLVSQDSEVIFQNIKKNNAGLATMILYELDKKVSEQTESDFISIKQFSMSEANSLWIFNDDYANVLNLEDLFFRFVENAKSYFGNALNELYHKVYLGVPLYLKDSLGQYVLVNDSDDDYKFMYALGKYGFDISAGQFPDFFEKYFVKLTDVELNILFMNKEYEVNGAELTLLRTAYRAALFPNATPATYVDPADLPDELSTAGIAFRAVKNGYGDQTIPPKKRISAYLKEYYPDLKKEAIERISIVANPDRTPGRKSYAEK